MTPKEKAIELIDKYKPYVYCYLGSGMLTNTESEEVILSNSKQCALIAVQEVLDLTPIKIFPEFRMFWQSVESEINNIEL